MLLHIGFTFIFIELKHEIAIITTNRSDKWVKNM
jgi:hypothetical protein